MTSISFENTEYRNGSIEHIDAHGGEIAYEEKVQSRKSFTTQQRNSLLQPRKSEVLFKKNTLSSSLIFRVKASLPTLPILAKTKCDTNE